MAVPPPNINNDPDGLATVRFYTKADPVFADTDNRPLSDLAERDRDLLNISTILGDKVGEDLTNPIVAGGPPNYPGPDYALVDGQTHNQSLGNLDTEADRVRQFTGKTNLAEVFPDYSPQTSHNVIAANDPLKVAIGKLDNAVPGVVPIGSIFMWGTNTAPANYLLCNGQAVSRTTFSDLFGVIQTTYGIGDGATTFNLPDLRQRFPLGKADSGTGQNLGDTGGAIDHNHTISTDGAHNHGGVTSFINVRAASPLVIDVSNNLVDDHNHTISTDGAHNHGGNTGDNNPPFLVVNYIIKA